MIVYLCGPVSLGGLCSPEEVADNVKRFRVVAAALRESGAVVLDPTEIQGGEGWEWRDWMRETIAMMLRADRVLTLPRWQESRGARLEVSVALELSMPVEFSRPDEVAHV